MLLFVILSAAGVAGIFWHFSRVSMKLIESKTLYDATLYSDAVREFRTLYTSEVVEVVRSQGIEITHDTKSHAGSIPLPATLSMELGKKIGSGRQGAETRLYSPFPFPWRKSEGGLRDEFEETAWEFLNKHPQESFYRFEDYKGRRSLRYATADLMRESCVDCHNTHPESPRTGWKVGDVRGVLEVIFPMDRIAAETHQEIRGTLGLMIALTAGGLGLLGLMIARLRRAGKALEENLEELQGAEIRLRSTNERLEIARKDAVHASDAKSQFLANMSHELRTPLNAIIGYSEMLHEEAGDLADGKFALDLQKIRSAGQSLLAMIDDVLDLTLYERDAVGLEIMSFEISELIREVEAVIRPKAEENACQLEIDCPSDVGNMHSDRSKLKRCLLNVLNNAVKFTRGGRISVQVRREEAPGGTWIVMTIEDTGAGMTEAETNKLFEMFSQGDGSRTKKFGGAGMGLALTRKMCLLMGGDIKGKGVPGKGSVFTIRLPESAATKVASMRSDGGGPGE